MLSFACQVYRLFRLNLKATSEVEPFCRCVLLHDVHVQVFDTVLASQNLACTHQMLGQTLQSFTRSWLVHATGEFGRTHCPTQLTMTICQHAWDLTGIKPLDHKHDRPSNAMHNTVAYHSFKNLELLGSPKCSGHPKNPQEVYCAVGHYPTKAAIRRVDVLQAYMLA
jgi:hypothetical protein